MNKWVERIFGSKKILLLFISVITLIISVQAYLEPNNEPGPNGEVYTKYNNYKIFQNSSYHLLEGKSLYQTHVEDHYDIFKYTPTFSLLMFPIAALPDVIGLSIWNLLNALILCFAIYSFPKLTPIQKGLIILIFLTQLIVNLQNEQSNALVAGLLIFAFSFMEKKKIFLASLCISLSVFIKLFGVVGFALFLFYPNKLKSAVYSLITLLVLGVLPILLVGIDSYTFQLQEFVKMLSKDHGQSVGYSVLGVMSAWFNNEPDKLLILIIGSALFLLPLIQIKKYSHYSFRLLFLCSLLIWVILFNHKSESPTFIIATAGFAIWFIYGSKTLFRKISFCILFVFICLTPTDLVPPYIRYDIIIPYQLHVIALMVVWVLLNIELFGNGIHNKKSTI